MVTDVDSARADRNLPAAVRAEGRERPSGDLTRLYSHQMGNGELLSRAEEIALAKRIEAAQQAVLERLCQIPMLIERIAGWGQEFAEWRLQLADMVDLSFSVELDLVGQEEDHTGGALLDLIGDDPPLQPKGEETLDPIAPRGSGPLASQQAAQLSVIAARLERLRALAQDVSSLNRKRLAARFRGRDLAKASGLRLQELVLSFASEAVALQLHPDRMSQLIEVLEREQQTLWQSERKLLRVGELCGINRQDLLDRHHGRELDPN